MNNVHLSESIDDFRKRYRGTYVFLDFSGDTHLVQYVEDSDNEFIFKSPKYGEIVLNEDTVRRTIKLKFPPSGLYNVAGNAVFFARIPARQWKRAPCQDNCVILNILNCFKRVPVKFSIETLNEIYNTIYPENLDKALAELKYSTALSNKFGISVSHLADKDTFLFWYKCNPIGVGYKSVKELVIFNKHLFQEVRDFCKRKETQWIPLLKNLQ